MKLLLKMFERMHPLFDEGKKLSRGKPLFDAMENFCFAPVTTTSTSPHIRDPLDVKRYMSMVIIALLPALLASFYFFGWRVLAVIIVSYAAGGIVEVIFAIVRKEEINEGFLVTGLIFPMVLPPTLPLWMVAVGVAFGVFVGKELFGGTGRNIFNPAMVGRCFLALAYPKAMSSSWVTPVLKFPGRLLQYVTTSSADAVTEATPVVSAITGATPLGMAKNGNWVDVQDLLIGNVTGSIGETCAIAIIIGGIFLILTRVSNWRTVVGTLGSFAILAWVLRLSDPESFGAVGWHMLAGGLLLGAFFMATDPVTSPITNGGKWIYGIIIGVVTVLIRNFTGYVEGVMFAILLGNIVAPILDEIMFRYRIRRLQNEQ